MRLTTQTTRCGVILHLASPLLALLVIASMTGPSWAQEAEPKKAPAKKSSFWRAPTKTPKIELTRKMADQLDNQIIPAIQADDENRFLTLAMPILQSSKPESLRAINRHCELAGVGSMSDRFVDHVLILVEQGETSLQSLKDPRTAKVVAERIVEKLNEFYQVALEHHVLQDPLVVPDEFQASEEMFWNIHVLHNEFSNAGVHAKFASTILEQKALRKSEEGQQLKTDLADVEKRLTNCFNAIEQRAAELRLKRFTTVQSKLGAEYDFETRLTSAMALEQDGQVLTHYLANSPALTRPALMEVGLAEKVKTELESGREAAGDVATKANLFRNGLHYWTRGRYGSGPLVRGLVKSKDASRSKAAMEALYMPRVRNKPISDFYDEEQSAPGFDRRHYYTWAAEHRPLVKRSKVTPVNSTSKTSVGETKLVNKQKFL